MGLSLRSCVIKYILRQKLLTLGERYEIRDQDNQPRFYVEGKFLSLGDKVSFYDCEGRLLVYIEEKIFKFLPTYELYRDNRLAARVEKSFTLFRDKYIIDIPGPDDYQIRGNFMDYEYVFERKGVLAASVSRKFFSVGDVYGVDIREGEDDVLILAATVVIDLVRSDSNSVFISIAAF